MFFPYANDERLCVPDVRVDMVESDEFVQLNGYGVIVAVKRQGKLVGWSPTWDFFDARCTEGR